MQGRQWEVVDEVRKWGVRVAELQGCGSLAVDGLLGLTHVAESVHRAIARTADPFDFTGPVTRLVYQSVRGGARIVGAGVDLLARVLGPQLRESDSSRRWDRVRAVLNGVIGDHLAESGNALAVEMSLRFDGRLLPLASGKLTVPGAGRRLMLFVHGLCSDHGEWTRQGEDPAARLASSFDCTPIHLQYNSGLHISTNGRRLSELLEALLRHWPVPVEHLTIIAHSMGGLVARSAYDHATHHGDRWPRQLRQLVFLGCPHHGTSLERAGNWVDSVLAATAYSAPIGLVGKIRSAGITDLRFGNTRQSDWHGDRFERRGDCRRPMPLPCGVECYAVAGAWAGIGGRILGDGLVPVESALGQHEDSRFALAFPESHRWIAKGVGHLGLLSDPGVYDRIHGWLAQSTSLGVEVAPPGSRRPSRITS